MDELSPIETQPDNTENLSELHQCKNCNNEFYDHYCNQCGQKWEDKELSVKGLIRSFYEHSLKNVKIFIQTSFALLLRPGTVIKEYREGKKLKYYNPFNYFLVIASIVLFITLQFSPLDAKKSLEKQQEMYGLDTAEEIEEKIKSENLSEGEAEQLRRKNGISQGQVKVLAWFQTHYNLLILGLVPVFALSIHLHFRKTGLSYSEHFLMTFHVYGFSTLLSVPILPLSDPFDVTAKIKWLSMPIFLIYFTWALKDIYKISWVKSAWKAILVYITNFLLIFGFMIAIGIVVLIFVLIFIFAKKAIGF